MCGETTRLTLLHFQQGTITTCVKYKFGTATFGGGLHQWRIRLSLVPSTIHQKDWMQNNSRRNFWAVFLMPREVKGYSVLGQNK